MTPLPTPPSRNDPTNFAARADAFLGALPTFQTEANALEVAVDADAVAAAASAASAASSVTAAQAAEAGAAAAANVTKWVSGTTYTEGAVVWSPINFLSYRRRTTGGGTTDPSADSTNWVQAAGTGNVTLNGIETLTNKTITAPTISAPTVSGITALNGPVNGVLVAVPALNIDCSAGNFFTKTISANSTFTFSNAPASKSFGFVLELTHTSGTVTWPTSVTWPGDKTPTLTTGKTHLFIFVTDDGGTRWRGGSLVDYTN
jgi:hypothetical protein